MAAFLSGVDCGPTNALKSVSGRLERDFSLHQDRLISTPNVAGPSHASFKQHIGHQAAPIPIPTKQTQSVFDLAALRQHLSPTQQHAFESAYTGQRAATSGWADSFPISAHAVTSRGSSRDSPWQAEFEGRPRQPLSYVPKASIHGQHSPPPWQYSQNNSAYHPSVPFVHPTFIPQPTSHASFRADPRIYEQTSAISEKPTTLPAEPLTEQQEVLAKTASAFVQELNASERILKENPKLAQSKFMTLLQGIGDREVVVQEGEHSTSEEEVGEGSKFVLRGHNTSDWASSFMSTSSLLDGGTHATDHQREPAIAGNQKYGQITRQPPRWTYAGPQQFDSPHQPIEQRDWEREFQDQEAISLPTQDSNTKQRRKSVHFSEESQVSLGNGVPRNLFEARDTPTSIPGVEMSWEETHHAEVQATDMDLLADLVDEDAFMHFNGDVRQAQVPRLGVGAMEGWGELQKDWEAFQRSQPARAGPFGLRSGDVHDRYLFHARNPYSRATEVVRTERAQSPTLKGILELEAAVQLDPANHMAWFDLGLKQQENERENQAILALSKVIQLSPDYRPAYLALAVSYTNEGENEAAHIMLSRWIDLGEGLIKHAESSGWTGGQERLVERLIDVARRSPEDVDADVQVALGVMFNSTDEYTKAEDCFLAALSVKPDDWLLWNRLGATLANSGRSSEAISYYHRALKLHPNFVRASFNLGISYTNLGQYGLAAQSILDALRLQHADASEGYAAVDDGRTSMKGVGSDALWNGLRNACLHMGRGDLVASAGRKDLSGFPLDMTPEVPVESATV